MLAYLWERLVFLSFAIPVFVAGMFRPANFRYLTYWTLFVHIAYFSVDKASPRAKAAVRLLHGFSFVGGMAVMMGYAVVCVGGIIRFGSWFLWETHKIEESDSASFRDFNRVLFQKNWEHSWPVLALLIDIFLSRSQLKRWYANSSSWLNFLLAFASYYAFGSLWQYCVSTGLKSNVLEVYDQPHEWSTSHIARALKQNGYPTAALEGLGEDFIFAVIQKIVMTSFAAVAYFMFVAPLATSTVDSDHPLEKAKKN